MEGIKKLIASAKAKNFLKNLTAWTVVFAVIVWSIGLPMTMLILPADAATNVNVSTIGLYNTSPGAPIKASSAITAIARIQIFTDQATQNLNAITVNFSGTGFATTDLAALATGNTSGVALYNDSAGNVGSAITVSAPSWATNDVTLTAASPVALTQSATSTFYIVIKTSASAVNGHQIIATIPANGVSVESTPVGPAAPFSANSLIVDTQGPTIVKAEMAGPQAVDVTFSEMAQANTAGATANYSLSGGLTVMNAMQQGPSVYRIIANNTITAASTTITVSANVLDLAGNANASTSPVVITAENRIKISEILVGAFGAATKEFVELYNGGDTAVNLQTSGYKLHIRAAIGTDTNVALTFATSTIPAYGYFLIASSQYSDIGLTPDATYDATVAGLVDNGGAYISTSATADTNIIDMVGWGTQPSGGYEGTAATSTTAGQSLERKAFGNSDATKMVAGGIDANMGNTNDTSNNYFDFIVRATPQPQNSSSAPEQPNFTNYSGPTGPMINHMPVNLAPTGADLNIFAQMGDPQNSDMASIATELHYMVGDGSPSNNITADYTTVLGSHQGNGYFKFTVPQTTIDGSTANGLYYYLKVATTGGTKYMSKNPEADNGGNEAAVAQNPFNVMVQASTGWTKHNITGTVKDQSNNNISGALVFLEGTGYNTTTASDGTFTLSNVKDSSYNLVIVKTGYYEGWFNNIFLNGAAFNIGAYTMGSGTSGGMTGDSTKPIVMWTGPNDGMFGVPPKDSNFKIFIGFSKDIDSSTVNNTNIYLTVDGSTASSSSVVYDNNPADNAAAGLPPDNYLGIVGMPAGGLMPNTTYYLVLTGNVRDTSGNPLQGNRAQGGHVVSFTTGGDFMSFNWGTSATSTSGFIFGAGDMKPPFVMGTMPFDGSMNVAPNTKINISFSDPMDDSSVTASGNVKLYKISIVNNAESNALVTASTVLDTTKKIAIITPAANLTAGKYRVVATGALKSATGIFMGNPGTGENTSSYEFFRSHFEIGANTAVDNTKPTISGTWPINNDTGIAVNPGQFNIQFSESMDPTSINSNTVTLKKGTSIVTGNVNYDSMARSASFAPTVVLTTDSIYTFTIVGSATATSSSVTDIVGNPMAANYVVSFTTGSAGDTDAPKIMFANGDDYGIAITFSEPMNSAKITDSANWNASVLKSSNYILKYGAPETATSTWTAITLTNASFNYDSNTNTAKIENLGLAPDLTSGKDYYVDMSASNAADLSGNLVASSTQNFFRMPIQSSAATMGMLGPMTGGGMTGGMMGPDMGNMGMMKAGAFPMNAMAGQTTVYFVDIPTTQAIANNYKVVLTFPQGFNVSGAKKDANSPINSDINEWNGGTISFSAAAETSGGANNDGVTVDAAARTVTITMAVATSTSVGTPPTSDFLHLDIGGIVNSSIPRDFNTSGYTVDMKIMDASGNLKETVNGMPFFINEGGSITLDGSITLTGATGATDGAMSVYLGSPMTGPMDKTITITDGTGAYSFSGLPASGYMLFTDPVITAGGVDWAGMPMPEPITLSASTTKNLTFAKQNSGSELDLTVNLVGAFGANDIDVFAGSPSGFRVKTIASPGTDPAAIHLYLPAGDWMVGVGPAMPKGPMSGPVKMPDWMPPMPQQIKSTGAGAAAITISIASASMQIIGYVTDGVATTSYPNGTPISAAEVWAYQPMGGGGMGAHATTDTDGKFTLKVAQAGNYTIGAFKPGLPGVPEKSVNVAANNSIDSGATDGNTTADIMADNVLITAANKFIFKIKKPAYTISGKVTNGANSVSYVPVWTYQNNGYGHADTMTDSSGNYILYVDNGSWVVNAYIPGYGDAESQAVVINGANATQNLSQNLSANYYTIGGAISIGGAAQTNLPIRAVELNSQGAYQGKEYRGSTDSSGVYSISVPGTGAADQYKYYRVDIWTPTYGEVGLTYDEVANNPANIRISNAATTTANITIGAGDLITLTISLANKSGYSGKEGFINLEGVSCSGATCNPGDFRKSIRLSDISGSDQTVQVKASSKYFMAIDIPGTGRYIPDLNANTGRDSTTNSVIATTTNRTVKFTLPDSSTNAATVSGTVTDGTNPLANVWVWVGNPNTGYFNGTSTIANGTYSLAVPTGAAYKTGAEKSGYLSPEPADLNASTSTAKNFALTAANLNISGYIYNDANTNSALDTGEAIANSWVRAETTDGAKKTQSPTDGNGYYSLGVVNGTWKVYGMANGYSESQLSSNVTVSGSSQTDKNIKLTVDSSWTNKSLMAPITPASGGTIDDTATSSTGVKLIIPPNALGSSAAQGNVTTAVTSAVVTTNSSEPFSDEGVKITAADNSGQTITNLNDYIDFEKVIYKSEVAAEISAGNMTLAKLKTMQNGYWDSTSNDWVSLTTTRSAYYKTNAGDTEWTLYSDSSAADSFEAFIDTLIAGTTYGDYKLVFTSKTNHLTIFAVILPFVATVSTPAPTVTPTTTTPGGSVPISTSYCSSVTYDVWQTTCVSGYQYRNVLLKSPSNCTLTVEQENNRKRTCGQTTLPEIISETKEQIAEIVGTTSQAAAEFAAKVVQIAADAAEIVKANVNALLGKLGFKRDLAKESVDVKKYVNALIKNVAGITNEQQNAMTNFIAYGTETTIKLGEGERAGVLGSYKSAYGKLPKTEAQWNDAIKIANGRWPSEINKQTEADAEKMFEKIYLRAPDRTNAYDDAAVMIIAYGLRPSARNLNSEKAAIKTFRAIFGYLPSSSSAWDIVRAIANSGAKR